MNGMHFEAWKCFCSFLIIVKSSSGWITMVNATMHSTVTCTRNHVSLCCNICEWNPWSPWAQRDHSELIFGVTISVISYSPVNFVCHALNHRATVYRTHFDSRKAFITWMKASNLPHATTNYPSQNIDKRGHFYDIEALTPPINQSQMLWKFLGELIVAVDSRLSWQIDWNTFARVRWLSCLLKC